METMEVSFLLAGLAVIICIPIIHLWRCKHRLSNHAFVVPLEEALPVNAPHVQQLISALSFIAGTRVPSTYVYRASLANAFVAALPLTPELYISDEVFEDANAADQSLEYLVAILAHEIAHLKLDHGMRHAALLYCRDLFIFRFMKSYCIKRLALLEKEADQEGLLIAKGYFSGNS
ncbi:MAG: M48 family metalloprotease [Mariprofundaceae bacterium]